MSSETPCATCGGRGFYEFFNNHSGERDEEACPDCQPTGETAGQGVEEAWVRGSDWDGYVTYLNPSTGGREKVSLAVEQAIRAEAERVWADDYHAWTQYIANLRVEITRLEARATAAEAERDRLREAVRHLSLRSMRFKGGEPGIGCDLCMQCWAEGDVEEHRDDCLAALAGESTDGGAA